MLFQLDRDGLGRVLPLSRGRVKRPIREHKVRVQALLYLCRARLQVLRISDHLLPEVALQILFLPNKHRLREQMAALKALGLPVLVSHD